MKAYRLEVDAYKGTLACLVVADNEFHALKFAIEDDSVWNSLDVRIEEVDASVVAGLKRFEFIQKEVTV